MTTKKDSVELDSMACILHAAELGVSYDEYVLKVMAYGKKRLKMITKGLKYD